MKSCKLNERAKSAGQGELIDVGEEGLLEAGEELADIKVSEFSVLVGLEDGINSGLKTRLRFVTRDEVNELDE